MTENQEKHFKATNLWVRSQKNFIENLEIAKGNSERMVKSHQDLIEITDEQLPIEQKFFEDGKRNFREWCEQNELPVPDWSL